MREITEKEIMDAFREDGQFKENTTNHFIFRAGYLAAQKTAHNSDYAKSCDDCIYGVEGCQHEPPCTTGTGKPYYKKRDFA